MCESYQSKSVCVIGAGPSGLVAARELKKEGQRVVVLEQNHDVGGQWLYDPNVEGEDPLGRNTTSLTTTHNSHHKVHSSVYSSLRLGSPREIMAFTDFPFSVKKGRDSRRFPGHRELLLYLQDFCDWFGLRDFIRFNTRVAYVGMLDHVEGCQDLRWLVKSYCDKYADYTGFPHLEEWKKKIFFITLNNYFTNLETYRDSLDDDDLIKEALQSPHFIEQEQDAKVSPL
ncbi:hypothetical protein ACLB2K_011252 [Fragaria x ananassa]